VRVSTTRGQHGFSCARTRSVAKIVALAYWPPPTRRLNPLEIVVSYAIYDPNLGKYVCARVLVGGLIIELGYEWEYLQLLWCSLDC